MIFLMNTYEIDEEGLPSDIAHAKLSRLAVDFITAIRAVTVSLGIYPPGSKTIANAVEKVSGHLEGVLDIKDEITFSEVGGTLLIDGMQLDERDRKKAPVRDFVISLTERAIQSLTFKKGTSSTELIDLLVIISKKPKELKKLPPIPEQMKERGITHIQTNERIYVATTQEELEEWERRQKFMAKYLLGDMMEAQQVNTEEIQEILQDQEQFQEILRSLTKVAEAEEELERGEFVRLKVDKLGALLSRSALMLDAIQDEADKEVFRDGLAEIMAEMDGEVLGNLLVSNDGQESELQRLDIQGKIIDKMGAPQIMGYTDNLIDQVNQFKKNYTDYSKEERQEKVGTFKEQVKMIVNNTSTKDHFQGVADKLIRAGLLKKHVAEELRKKAEGILASDDLDKINLINADGTINKTALDTAIMQFERVPGDKIPSVLSGMVEILGEVVYHEGIDGFIDKLVDRLDMEWEYSKVYIGITEFLEKLGRELIFNENYKNANKIVRVFRKHSNPATERHSEQKQRAFAALNMISSEEVNRMLLTVFQHGEEDTREYVSELIVNMGMNMIGAMVELLKTAEDRRLRRNVLLLLQKMGKAVLDVAHDELKNGENEWYVTRNMLTLIGDLGKPHHTEWVEPLMGHSDQRVRKEAIKALATLDPESAVETIRIHLNDSDPIIRRQVIAILGTLRDQESIESIAKIIEKRSIAQVEEDDALQMEAVMALEKMRNESVVPYLIVALKKEGLFSRNRTKSHQLRARIAMALAGYPSDEVAKALKIAGKDNHPEVAEAAKMSLLRMKT